MSSALRDRLVILSCVVALTVLAWAYLIHLSRQMSESMAYDQMMAEMGMPMEMSWTPATVLLTFGMWSVMMAGMMSASATPMLLMVARSTAARSEVRFPLPALAFGAGYLAVWVLFSGVAALAQWGLHEAAVLSPGMTVISPWIASAILFAAGAYQLTPFKRACLVHCRSPIDFLVGHWRSGVGGAVRMGLHHGAYCLGCCWALMVVLLVVGVMNLAWVAGIGVFVLLEKTGPAGVVLSRIAGAGLVFAGLILFLRAAGAQV